MYLYRALGTDARRRSCRKHTTRDAPSSRRMDSPEASSVRAPLDGGVAFVPMARPIGIVTFLFTDIEDSTPRWESDPDGMRHALAVHDDVLRTAIEAQGGWLFKHTGDGVCAAFASPRAAVDAAIIAQQSLALPVRMGI